MSKILQVGWLCGLAVALVGILFFHVKLDQATEIAIIIGAILDGVQVLIDE